MWQQMLILIALGWIVGAAVVPEPRSAVATMKINSFSSAPPNNNDSVDLSETTREGSVPEQESKNITNIVTDSSRSSESSKILETSRQSESSSSVHETDTPKSNNTESSTTTTTTTTTTTDSRSDLTEVIKVNDNSSGEVKEPPIERTIPKDDPNMKADGTQDDRDPVPDNTDDQVDEGNDQKGNKSNETQLSVRDGVVQTSINASEKEEGNTSEVASDPKPPRPTESSGSPDSSAAPPPNVTIPVETEHSEPPKNISSTSTSTTTVATKVDDEGSIDSPFEDINEIPSDIGPQPSEMNQAPPDDENYDKVDLLAGKEDFVVEKTVIDNGGKFSDDEDSHFFAYFLTIMVTAIIFYLIFHNKQRIIALIIEGRAPSTRSRRSSRKVRYHKLDNNLEEAITATKGAKYDRIY